MQIWKRNSLNVSATIFDFFGGLPAPCALQPTGDGMIADGVEAGADGDAARHL